MADRATEEIVQLLAARHRLLKYSCLESLHSSVGQAALVLLLPMAFWICLF